MGNLKSKSGLPLWDLSHIYKGFDDEFYIDDKNQLTEKFRDLLEYCANKDISIKEDEWLEEVIKKTEAAESLYENLYSFCYTCYSVETGNPRAIKELNVLEKEKLMLYKAKTEFRKNFTFSKQQISAIIKKNSFLAEYELFLKETEEFKNHQLAPEIEELVEELLPPGANAWSRLQEAISSELSVKWDKETGERKTVTELRSLACDSNRKIRKKAYNKEIKAWKSAEIPLAYALNGVKGFGIILNKRSVWSSAID
jgi:oligoendopeptidase F